MQIIEWSANAWVFFLEKNFEFVDFSDSINKIDDRKGYAPKGTHLSPAGYEAVASDLKRVIKEYN